MNVKAYYQKIQELERTLSEPFVVIVSHDTSDGGREGLLTEVGRHLAARMIADGRAHLATTEAARQFHQTSAEAKRSAEEALLSNRSHGAPVITPELRRSTRTQTD